MARRHLLPAFALYGEAGTPPEALLHVESIEARSRRYRWEIETHVHHGLHQLLWLHAGPVIALLDESRIEAEGPQAFAIPPATAHAFRFTPASEGHVLTFDARALTEGDAERTLGDALQRLFAVAGPVAVPAHQAARLDALFRVLLAEHEAADHGPLPGWLARSVLWRVAGLAARDAAVPRRGAGSATHYTRWVALAEAHYREHWPVTRYAERLGLSAERLNRMVRAETGRSVQALLHERLVREACRRLVHVAAPVSRIAFELGFEDPAYFCRFFKRHVGRGPREYRAAHGG
ncbi:MAG: helix-turn-helix domain-containing protein [Piscinibacter sp.]|nr:helix-turn-helix domain-containing protein [Piscinibacter sp.]